MGVAGSGVARFERGLVVESISRDLSRVMAWKSKREMMKTVSVNDMDYREHSYRKLRQ